MLQVQKKFWGKRPGLDLGDVLHVGVTLLFALVLFLLVRDKLSLVFSLIPTPDKFFLNPIINLPAVFSGITAFSEPSMTLAVLASGLIILSKWRVLAVQPRFWLPNIKANLIDTIVGLGTVVLMYQAPSSLSALFWMITFTIWLLLIKPKDSNLMVGVQALWAQSIGVVTVFATFSMLRASLIGVLLVWLVSWAVARHFLANYEEPHYKSLSLVWAFLVAQLAWVGLHWVSYYPFFGFDIANTAVIITVLAATVGVLYHGYKTDSLKKNSVTENVVFGAAIIIIVLLTSSWTAEQRSILEKILGG